MSACNSCVYLPQSRHASKLMPSKGVAMTSYSSLGLCLKSLQHHGQLRHMLLQVPRFLPGIADCTPHPERMHPLCAWTLTWEMLACVISTRGPSLLQRRLLGGSQAVLGQFCSCMRLGLKVRQLESRPVRSHSVLLMILLCANSILSWLGTMSRQLAVTDLFIFRAEGRMLLQPHSLCMAVVRVVSRGLGVCP